MDEQENYNLTFTDLKMKEGSKSLRDFLAGKINPQDFHETFSQYILLNLVNVTLHFVPLSTALKTAGKFFPKRKLGKADSWTTLWTGAVDCLIQNTAASPRFIFHMHFSPSFLSGENRIVSAVNPDFQQGVKRFSSSGFEEIVWITTMISILVLSIVSVFLLRVTNGRRHGGLRLCYEYVWFYVSSLLQNQPNVLQRPIGKIMLAGWLLGMSVLTKAYSGNLKSVLSVSKSVHLNSIQDVWKLSPGTKAVINSLHNFRSVIKRFGDRNSDEYRFVKESKSVDMYFEEEDFFGSFPNGTIKYVTVETAFNLKIDIIQNMGKLLKKASKKLYMGQEVYLTSHASLPFSKKIPRRIKENIDYLTLRFVETSQLTPYEQQMDYHLNIYFLEKRDTNVNNVKKMTIEELSNIFYIWAYGILMSCVIFLLEIIFTQIL